VLTVQEKSRAGFAFIFEDEELQAFIPTTVRYRLHDPDSNRELIAWTSVEPSAEILVVIPATANDIEDANLAFERRILTVQSDYDTDDQLSQEREYRIQNLSGFT
jgi:hypothetical protein